MIPSIFPFFISAIRSGMAVRDFIFGAFNTSFAYISWTLPLCTPRTIFFRSSSLLISLLKLLFTMMEFVPSKYTSEKSTDFFLSSVGVMDVITMSTLEDCRAIIRASKSIALISSFTPISSAIFLARSISAPTTWLLPDLSTTNSNGG